MLRVVDAGRPIAVSEQIIWRVLSDIKLALTPVGVRRELTYLRDSGLLELEGEETETWFAKLTASGVDVVEYNYPAPAGVIGRSHASRSATVFSSLGHGPAGAREAVRQFQAGGERAEEDGVAAMRLQPGQVGLALGD